MKKIILLLIIILELISIKIPKYVELNNLIIIEKIAVEKNNNLYTITLKEITPTKQDQGINYKTKYYQETSTSLEKAYKKIISSTKKKFYLNKAKSLITNINNSKKLVTFFDISPSSIIHTNNVEEKIKD